MSKKSREKDKQAEGRILADFQARLEEADKIKDQGTRVLELDRVKDQIAKFIEKEQVKIRLSGLGGLAGIGLGGYGFGAGIILALSAPFGLLPVIAAGSMTSGILYKELCSRRTGREKFPFLQQLEAKKIRAQSLIDQALSRHLSELAQSDQYGAIVTKFPALKEKMAEAFRHHAVEKPAAPVPSEVPPEWRASRFGI